MRTKDYDVNMTGRILSIVRLKDGAIVADAEIPAEATDAVVAVLKSAPKEDASTVKNDAPSAEPTTESPKKKTTTKKTTASKTTKTAETTNDVQSVQTT